MPTSRRTLAVGVLSGTSMDGIDVAIVSDPLAQPRSISAKTYPYSRSTSRMLLDSGANEPERIARLNAAIAEDFASAVNRLIERAGIPRKSISVIGSHGQTIFHIPGYSSLQLGSPAIIAERTGLPVAADFRMDDVAVGGEGAPLVPALDRILFSSRSRRNRLGILNLGGIANVTVLDHGRIECAYDIGPANGIIDAAMRLCFGQRCDRGGRIARDGKINAHVLDEAMRHDFFKLPPPRTTGPELFGDAFVARHRRSIRVGSDLVATMTAISVESTARELNRLKLDEVYVSGGAIHNPVFMDRLRMKTVAPIQLTSAVGVDPDFKEALLFAHLGILRVLNKPVDLTSVTGARRPKILGGLWLP